MGGRDSQVDQVGRAVDAYVTTDGKGRVVTLSQTYETSIEDLWDACTSPERLARWFAPVTGEFESGGRYQIEGNAEGTIQTCDRPTKLAVTWEYAGDISHVELRLTAEGDNGTRFELRHYTSEDDHWDRYGPGATGVGWDYALFGLAGHVGGWAGSSEEEEQWLTSSEGQRFTTEASHKWRQAAVAFGDDPAVAAARAERTTAAYTGQEEPA